LQSKATLTVNAVPIEIPEAQAGGAFPGGTLESQVERLAERVTEMVMGSIERKKLATRSNGKAIQASQPLINKGEMQ